MYSAARFPGVNAWATEKVALHAILVIPRQHVHSAVVRRLAWCAS